jgi:hypothetical protein
MVKAILLGGKDYVDFLPYERSETAARLLFRGGRPYTLLDDHSRQALTRCLRVRNYIAHRSEFAKSKYLKSYQQVKPMITRAPSPIKYLDDHIRLGVTMFENDLTQLHSISRFLS